MSKTETIDKAAIFDGLHPIFRDCIDPHATRRDMETPVAVGGHVYATDGAIIVRSPLSSLSLETSALVPNGAQLAEAMRGVFERSTSGPERAPFEIPKLRRYSPARCWCCKGTGRDEDDDFCWDCRGTGKLRVPRPVDVGNGFFFDLRMLHVLKKHRAECSLRPAPTTYGNGRTCGPDLLFRVDGGRVEGLLARMLTKEEAAERDRIVIESNS